jgi:lysozyme family protein
MLDRALVSDVEPLSWKDIEALPYYVFGALALVGTVYALSDAGPVLQTTLAKAVLIFGMIGLRYAWIGMEK